MPKRKSDFPSEVCKHEWTTENIVVFAPMPIVTAAVVCKHCPTLKKPIPAAVYTIEGAPGLTKKGENPG